MHLQLCSTWVVQCNTPIVVEIGSTCTEKFQFWASLTERSDWSPPKEFTNGGANIRKITTIFKGRHASGTDDPIKLFLTLLLFLGVGHHG